MTDQDKAWCRQLAEELVKSGIEPRRAARIACEQWWALRRAARPPVPTVSGAVARVLAAHNVRRQSVPAPAQPVAPTPEPAAPAPSIRPAWAQTESP